MQSAATLSLVRDNLSDAVVVELRNRIVDGRLPEGERINEVQLSQQLGVSRTPVREALARLAHEGALRSVPRIGYFVRPLTVEEFEQLYAIRPLLDPEALRMAGIPSKERLEKLRQINDRIAAANDPDAIIDLDDQWHLELLAGCPNEVLLDLVRQFMRRTRRYEIGLMRDGINVDVTHASHKSILAALRRRDLDAACSALKKNLQTGFEPILDWLETREVRK
jgi:DNA-binding GntR family transcriptional regulator